MTAAPMATSSYPLPAAGCPTLSRAVSRIPETAASDEAMTNTLTLIRRTRMPESLAASSFDPTK